MGATELLDQLCQRAQFIETRIVALRTTEETQPLDPYTAGSFRELTSEHAFLIDLIDQLTQEGTQSHAD